MTTTLSHEDRLEFAVLGWQAECALQHNASHLAASWRFGIGNDMMPAEPHACVAIGREALRAHLAAVRGDPDRTMIATPTSDPLAPPPVTPKFEAVLTGTFKIGTRTRTTQLLVQGDPADTIPTFVDRLAAALVSMAHE